MLEETVSQISPTQPRRIRRRENKPYPIKKVPKSESPKVFIRLQTFDSESPKGDQIQGSPLNCPSCRKNFEKVGFSQLMIHVGKCSKEKGKSGLFQKRNSMMTFRNDDFFREYAMDLRHALVTQERLDYHIDLGEYEDRKVMFPRVIRN